MKSAKTPSGNGEFETVITNLTACRLQSPAAYDVLLGRASQLAAAHAKLIDSLYAAQRSSFRPEAIFQAMKQLLVRKGMKDYAAVLAGLIIVTEHCARLVEVLPPLELLDPATARRSILELPNGESVVLAHASWSHIQLAAVRAKARLEEEHSELLALHEGRGQSTDTVQ